MRWSNVRGNVLLNINPITVRTTTKFALFFVNNIVDDMCMDARRSIEESNENCRDESEHSLGWFRVWIFDSIEESEGKILWCSLSPKYRSWFHHLTNEKTQRRNAQSNCAVRSHSNAVFASHAKCHQTNSMKKGGKVCVEERRHWNNCISRGYCIWFFYWINASNRLCSQIVRWCWERLLRTFSCV